MDGSSQPAVAGSRPATDSLRKARTTLRSLVERQPLPAAVPQPGRRRHPARAGEARQGGAPLRQPRPLRPPGADLRLAHRRATSSTRWPANLNGMTGSSLRRLDVVSDFTLTDDAFIVLLSPPRSAPDDRADDLAAVTRRVYERLQSLLLNDLAPGVYDRVHPSVGAAILEADDELTFEQNLQQGVALAMQAAAEQAAVYDARAGDRRSPIASSAPSSSRCSSPSWTSTARPCSATAAACAGPSTRRCGSRTCCSTSRATRRCCRPTASPRARPP